MDDHPRRAPRENVVNARFTDAELLDITREAARQDRKVAELVHFAVMVYLHGHCSFSAGCCEGADRASGGRR